MLLAQGLDGLAAAVVELAGLADGEAAGAEDEHPRKLIRVPAGGARAHARDVCARGARAHELRALVRRVAGARERHRRAASVPLAPRACNV